MKKKQPSTNDYRVRFTTKSGAAYIFSVQSVSISKALVLARYEAGQAGIPVMECREEVL